MRKLWVICLALLLLTPTCALAEEADASLTDGVTAWLNTVDWTAFERQIAALPPAVRALWDGVLPREKTAENALPSAGETGFPTGEKLLSRLAALLKGEGKRLGTMLTAVLGIALTGGLSTALMEEGKKGVSDAAAFACRCMMLTTVLGIFASGAREAVEGAETMARGMEALTPALITLLTAMGATGSAGVFQPAMALLVDGVAAAVGKVVVPLTVMGAVLGFMDTVTDRPRLTELYRLLKDGVKWMIGGVGTLYGAVTAVRGMQAAALDSVSVRAAKYAAGSLFPAAGGLVTGSFDTMLGCAQLVKNALGGTALLLCVSMAATPLLRLGVRLGLVRLAAAVCQPVAEKRQTEMLRLCGDQLTVLLSAMAVLTAMFLVTVGLMTGLIGFGGAG